MVCSCKDPTVCYFGVSSAALKQMVTNRRGLQYAETRWPCRVCRKLPWPWKNKLSAQIRPAQHRKKRFKNRFCKRPSVFISIHDTFNYITFFIPGQSNEMEECASGCACFEIGIHRLQKSLTMEQESRDFNGHYSAFDMLWLLFSL